MIVYFTKLIIQLNYKPNVNVKLYLKLPDILRGKYLDLVIPVKFTRISLIPIEKKFSLGNFETRHPDSIQPGSNPPPGKTGSTNNYTFQTTGTDGEYKGQCATLLACQFVRFLRRRSHLRTDLEPSSNNLSPMWKIFRPGNSIRREKIEKMAREGTVRLTLIFIFVSTASADVISCIGKALLSK